MSKVLPKSSLVFHIISNNNEVRFDDREPGYITNATNFEFIRKEFKTRTANVSLLDTNHSIYIGKNSLMPRFKLKKFFHEHRLSKTKLPASAKYALLNKQETSEFLRDGKFGFVSGYYFDKQDTGINKIINDFRNKEGLPQLYIYNNPEYNGFLVDESSPLINKYWLRESLPQLKSYIYISPYGLAKNKQTFDNLFEIFYNKKCEIIYDEDVLGEINEQGHSIDEDYYETLNSMLISPDQNTIKLAIEIIANSNYVDSYVRISMLLTTHWKYIFTYKNLFTSNFKSLLIFLEAKKGILPSKGYKELVKQLKQTDTSPETVKLIHEYIIFHLNKETNSYFEIKDITI